MCAITNHHIRSLPRSVRSSRPDCAVRLPNHTVFAPRLHSPVGVLQRSRCWSFGAFGFATMFIATGPFDLAKPVVVTLLQPLLLSLHSLLTRGVCTGPLSRRPRRLARGRTPPWDFLPLAYLFRRANLASEVLSATKNFTDFELHASMSCLHAGVGHGILFMRCPVLASARCQL